ncbi:acyl-CoA/acyl-ACP dehydrogenase [Phormidium tenue FACHB-886]|nr:acyl-CoA/acyl-ACP dehydrogenase [Phormidium tenue FACHB-886]
MLTSVNTTDNSIPSLNQAFLRQTEAYLQAAVAPQAAQLDHDSEALRQAFLALGDRNLLALRITAPGQATGLDDLSFRAFQELVARYSGALAFLQIQHQSAAALIAQSQNLALKQDYLPFLANGQKRVGLGFSQLRRAGEPLVKATTIPNGYQLQGEVPWITGHGCFQSFIIGATMPDGQALYGLMPFTASTQAGGSIAFSPPLQLAAMASTNTVTATVQNWVLDQSQIVMIQPAEAIHQSDRKNALHHSFFALGCARAGLDILAGQSTKAVTAAFAALDRELSICRQQIYQAEPTEAVLSQRLKLRAWAIDLAGRCSQAAVAVSRGAANHTNHPAQRIYREALAFTVFGQTTAVMEATLLQLSRQAQLCVDFTQ